MGDQQPYFTIRSRRPADGNGALHTDAPGVNGVGDVFARSATHDTSRASFHIKHIGAFARRLEDSAARAFPNRGRTSQRYKKVQALLLHWGSDDLFVLPELEDLEKCLREDFAFGTDIFAIPSENSHLELMMRVGQLIKECESQDTLFLIYYGGHARIDESRQSTWCATRDQSSPWLQWSAIQTLLERSKSDVLILLDCCAGAASATFPNGNSITETISASSWDAIAPDPGRYSFTNALIEVLQEWRLRTFSAAMLHAEVLARLKHPRPITINGKHFEARSTPVHFMMTANHKAPSIELSRVLPPEKVTESASSPHHTTPLLTGRAANSGDPISNGLASNEPNEDTPHVMISLALEDDQRLDINAWEQWLNAFPSMAKYVKVQGVFKSHSTLMLVSMPVMVWDLLPEDPAVSFVAFIRSNNLATQRKQTQQRVAVPVASHQQQRDVNNFDNQSIASAVSGTTFAPTEDVSFQQQNVRASPSYGNTAVENASSDVSSRVPSSSQPPTPGRSASPSTSSPRGYARPMRPVASATSLNTSQRQATVPVVGSSGMLSRQMVLNQQQSMRRTTFEENAPEPKKFSAHVERRLEEYYQQEPAPDDAHSAFIASNLGIELWHLKVWFHHRRDRDSISSKLATMKLKDVVLESNSHERRMILPADLNRLLELSLPGDSLLFDLRSAAEYERSHVHGAINLRIPKSFLQAAPLDLIERAIPDEQGRRQLSQWNAAKFLVFYGRGLESSREPPAAELITQKLRAQGWTGHCFILRGHYREFSQSFDKFIVGAKTTQAAKDWNSSSQAQATALTAETDGALVEDQHAPWPDCAVGEDGAWPPSTSPGRAQDRHHEAIETQEKDLEAEFRARCGPLFGKVMDMHMSSHGCDNLGMVEHLDRGLDKMRGAAHAHAHAHAHAPTAAFAPGHTRLASGDGKASREQDVDAEYVEVSRSDGPAPLTPAMRSDGNVTSDRAGGRGGGGGGGGGGASLLNKIFRR